MPRAPDEEQPSLKATETVTPPGPDEEAHANHVSLKELLRAVNLEGVDLTRDETPTPDIELQ